MTHKEIKTFACVCNQCGHGWVTRQHELPKNCPQCTTECWDRQKKKAGRPKKDDRGGGVMC